MKIAKLEFFPVSVPYTHREVSSLVNRDGVTDIVVKATADNGLVGWGESCSGADAGSVLGALRAMAPFVMGCSPWESERIRQELWHRGIWSWRQHTACFAYPGIDMALWDICGKACGEPLYNLFGGKTRERASYFFYCSQGTNDHVAAQAREGLAKGFRVFYLKVGLDIEAELEMVRTLRQTIGPEPKIRLDANAAWRVNEALRNLARLDKFNIDFIEQPVVQDPPAGMREVRDRGDVAVSANEGLWTPEDAVRQMAARTADVYCFSPYFAGSLAQFQRLSWLAHYQGFEICRHTHGELGITAAACHHILLTLPNVVEGNQQTAHLMTDDIVTEEIPITNGPEWGVPEGPGIGVDVDPEKLGRYHELYLERGQFQPYDPALIGKDLYR
ncbi:MAG TPA: mandelate racemase/muconate lactonizing enzyme family protein [Bryobacteraceae bacterium]|jgi:L-alanine-DL-glutamate epimerase-like enolase superfamily enzyme|nr:mandelate racemase/muconate lactonizing enzyme family protein [Bryobacteraceae bacterium]